MISDNEAQELRTLLDGLIEHAENNTVMDKGDVLPDLERARELAALLVVPQNTTPTDESPATVQTIAELLWNADGAPAMTDSEYEAKYVPEAQQNYNDYRAGKLDPWWLG